MNKKILIDIGHPAQVHQFKNIYFELINKNYEVFFVAKNKEISIDLLNIYKIPYFDIGKPKKGFFKKVINIPVSCYKFYKVCKKIKPSIILSRISIHSAWVSYLLKINHIGFSDTENIGIVDNLTIPFVNVKLTSLSYEKQLGKNHFRFPGYIESFYLHRNRFKPDFKIVEKYLGLNKQDKYVIIRFVSWNAHHDIGINGISDSNKIKLVNNLTKYAKVFISSECKLPKQIEKYKISIPIHEIHHIMAFSSLLYGESATMASECACLGVPSIFLDNAGRGYTNEQELKYGLVSNYSLSLEDQEKSIIKAIDLVTLNKSNLIDKYRKLCDDTIDVTKFVIWVVINFPNSIDHLKNDKNIFKDF